MMAFSASSERLTLVATAVTEMTACTARTWPAQCSFRRLKRQTMPAVSGPSWPRSGDIHRHRYSGATFQTDIQQAVASVRLGPRQRQYHRHSGTLSSLAEQTNLLALQCRNRSCPRGRQGRGFAVVADEVRKSGARKRQRSPKKFRAMNRALAEGQRDTSRSGAAKPCHALNRVCCRRRRRCRLDLDHQAVSDHY